jgi:transposase InsO family protein
LHPRDAEDCKARYTGIQNVRKKGIQFSVKIRAKSEVSAMPWEERTVERTRTNFVYEVIRGEKPKSHLCKEYGITRRTGDKWLNRAKNGEELRDRIRREGIHPNKTEEAVEELILETRIHHPAWGARKLKRYLENRGHTGLPAQSTICEILKRNGMISPEESAAHTPYKRFEKEHPNEMWQMDFKGDFGLVNSVRCHPLTVLDDCSRYSICLEAKENQQGTGVFESFGRLFDEYGLPASVLCDNGSPWGDSKSGSITQFDVWMMQLGILPIHIRPKRPQTQGKEERFHRTLKEEVLKREFFNDIQAAQRRFDSWRYEYNYERPHNALNLETPSKRYRISKRPMPAILKEPEYDSSKNLRKVNCKGYISIRSHRYFMSDSLIDKILEIYPISQTEVALFYGDYRVAKIDIDERIFTSRRIYRRDSEI